MVGSHDEAYVSEMRHCLKHPNVIEQAKLQSAVAARSAKLFYYLGQCLAKWERGLLRSVSKRQLRATKWFEHCISITLSCQGWRRCM